MIFKMTEHHSHISTSIVYSYLPLSLLVSKQRRVLKQGLLVCGRQHYNAERKTPTAHVAKTRHDKAETVVKTRVNDAKHHRKCRVRVVHLDETDGNHTTQTGN